MKLLKRICIACISCLFLTIIFNCASNKYSLEDSVSFQFDRSYYQEWFAGIHVGGTGINLFFPNLNSANSVVIDSVYFRNLKGKLVKDRASYVASLKNKSPYDTSKTVVDIPFKLLDNECVISYYENGIKKYFKVSNIAEKEGIYYEDGPPEVITSYD
ncbi:hypothetical protein [Hanstruepera flava]|uniref:hypothetical protein n=1 Tax=Hanstruepera flava TaxID=2930218 RepID=UPI002028A0CE|nr:hypothetical protein [Hanstruepera flava]